MFRQISRESVNRGPSRYERRYSNRTTGSGCVAGCYPGASCCAGGSAGCCRRASRSSARTDLRLGRWIPSLGRPPLCVGSRSLRGSSASGWCMGSGALGGKKRWMGFCGGPLALHSGCASPGSCSCACTGDHSRRTAAYCRRTPRTVAGSELYLGRRLPSLEWLSLHLGSRSLRGSAKTRRRLGLWALGAARRRLGLRGRLLALSAAPGVRTVLSTISD